MKLRVTKTRVVVALVLLPVLYVLNAGSLVYCSVRFKITPLRTVQAMYNPLEHVLPYSCWELLVEYANWSGDLANPPRSFLQVPDVQF